MANTGANDFNAQELGLPLPSPKPTTAEGQPRGKAMYPVAHPSTFAGLFSAGNRSYYQWFDEALRHGAANAGYILNDPVIYSCLRNRITPTALLTQHTKPFKDTDSDQVKAAKNYDRFKTMFIGDRGNSVGYLDMRRWLLYNGVFKGRSGAFVRWEKHWDADEYRTFESPMGARVIDGDKFAFNWDGRIGITVGSGFQGPTDFVAGFGRVYFFTDDEREQTAVFKYETEDAEFFSPEHGGLIHGTGLRHRLYWLWALKARLWSASIDFLEWWARGILIFYFEHGNESHLEKVSQWVETFDGQWQRLFPRLKDGGPNYKPIERIEPSNNTNTFLQDLITNYLDDLIRYVILGQTATQKSTPTGLGSGQTPAHQDTFAQIVKYDANYMDACETVCLLKPWYATNYPGMPHGYAVSEVDSPNVQQLMDAAGAIYEMGGNVPEDPLLEAAGLPETKEGDTLLTQVQPMQPAAVSGVPEGVPIVDGQSADSPAAQSFSTGDQTPVKMSAKQWARLCRAGRTNPKAAQVARLLRYRVRLI